MCMLDEIYAIARAHKAEKLWVFGSCARKEETPESDVDFLVKFGKDVGHRDYTVIENFCSSLLWAKRVRSFYIRNKKGVK